KLLKCLAPSCLGRRSLAKILERLRDVKILPSQFPTFVQFFRCRGRLLVERSAPAEKLLHLLIAADRTWWKRWDRRRCRQTQQPGSFRAETVELFILRLIFIHPFNGLVVPPAGVVLVPQLPVGQGHEKGVPTDVFVLLQRSRFLQRVDGG